jgi:hypothetical protein
VGCAQAHTAAQDAGGFIFDQREVEVLLHLEAVDPRASPSGTAPGL